MHWANIIDGAQYADAKSAVELGAPAMKLTLVIEGAKGSDIVQQIIGWMQQRPLEEIVAEPEIQALYEPLYERHLNSIDMIREPRASRRTAWFSSTSPATTWKATTSSSRTTCFPNSIYTVSVSPSSFRTKISVGSNPWAPEEPKHNLATICERYGGGGHAARGRHQLRAGRAGEGADRWRAKSSPS